MYSHYFFFLFLEKLLKVFFLDKTLKLTEKKQYISFMEIKVSYPKSLREPGNHPPVNHFLTFLWGNDAIKWSKCGLEGMRILALVNIIEIKDSYQELKKDNFFFCERACPITISSVFEKLSKYLINECCNYKYLSIEYF